MVQVARNDGESFGVGLARVQLSGVPAEPDLTLRLRIRENFESRTNE